MVLRGTCTSACTWSFATHVEFVLCGTVPGVAPAGRYPAPYVDGARTFLPRSLSTIAGAAVLAVLRRLDERQLRDIGIDRGEIEAASPDAIRDRALRRHAMLS